MQSAYREKMNMNIVQMLQKWSFMTVVLAFYLVYKDKAGGFQQLLVDLQTMSIDKLKTKIPNMIMAGIAVAVLFGVQQLKLPPVAKLGISLAFLYVFGFNLAKIIDPPSSGFSTGTQAMSSYFGRN